MDLLTPEYKALLVEKHLTSPWGGGGWTWAPDICRLVIKHKIKHPKVLEYGSGRRTLRNAMQLAMPHVDLTEYDPGVAGIDRVPTGEYDIVVCTDVMEHVELQYVDATLKRLLQYTRYTTIFNICCTPSKSLLPNGQNAHITVQEPKWWRERIERLWNDIEIRNDHKNFTLYASR